MRDYATEQRKCLLSFFEKHPDRHFAVEELVDAIEGISLSTIYRNVNQMVAEGTIRRFQNKGRRTFLYQYIGTEECSEHLHLKCSKCGRILHMDEAAAEAVTDAVKNIFDFEVDKNATILFGACNTCK